MSVRQQIALVGFLVLAGLALPRLAAAQCRNTCELANNGDCNDGGTNAITAECELGTDCTDCGLRVGTQARSAPVVAPSPTRVPDRPPEDRPVVGLWWTDTAYGVQVLWAHNDSPGYIAGIRDGDFVVQIDGVAVTDVETAQALVDQHRPGDLVDFTYQRDADTVTTTVTLGVRADLADFVARSVEGEWVFDPAATALLVLPSGDPAEVEARRQTLAATYSNDSFGLTLNADGSANLRLNGSPISATFEISPSFDVSVSDGDGAQYAVGLAHHADSGRVLCSVFRGTPLPFVCLRRSAFAVTP